MKVRNGFVANSSSSSYSVNGFGIVTNKDEINKSMYEMISCEDLCTEGNFCIDCINGSLVYEELLRVHKTDDPDSGEFYLYATIDDMKDGETKIEFKERIINALKKICKSNELYKLQNEIVELINNYDLENNYEEFKNKLISKLNERENIKYNDSIEISYIDTSWESYDG